MRPPSDGEPAGQGSPPERQPPSTPSIRASAQERDETVQRLQTAFAEGRLNVEEFEAYVRAALTAQTQEELGGLLADLPAPTVRPAPARRVGTLVLAVMGGEQRRGRWRVPERYTAVAVMGGYSLDLWAAQLSAPVTAITAVAIMGGVEVVVPPSVRVEMHGLPLLDGWSNHVREEDLPPHAPEVHVRGVALMGGVEARSRKPTPKA